MPKKTDFYKGLKLLGTQKEQELNDKIREFINNRSFIESISNNSQQQVPRINKFQEASERMSIIMNYPTKQDVANVAKLVIQLEEKVDKVEELLLHLTEGEKRSSRRSSRNKKRESTGQVRDKKKISDFLFDSLLSNAKVQVKGL
ncbi:hypothetical protein ACQKIC_11625 [Peribacillus sp. NPDC046944]|uniref:hypothetical protein n=1 Tax=unclassified Peribacillus TaxID=2675266 RepID=UPI003824A796